ncbi:hypothetical protein A4A49_15526 [Nicotiana attenuata]|uniref:SWIM-type domain-containing protein n=1 Tax=Nicotiana attenuata TaxID=49451 RepID=A0A314KW36_NICAT|nr:hypothetical protein A4A49_15526 [Nicotiana attenuata]
MGGPGVSVHVGEGIGVNVGEGIGVYVDESIQVNTDEGINVTIDEGIGVNVNGGIGISVVEDIEVKTAEGSAVNVEQTRATFSYEDINVEESATAEHDNTNETDTNLSEDENFGEDDLEDISEEDDSEIDDELKSVRNAASLLKHGLQISPMARLVLMENKEIGRKLKVQWNAKTRFEVNEGMYSHTVDIQKKRMQLQIWQLRGIPCQHAICAFYKIGNEAEDYVEHWYRKDTFLSAYQYYIQPIPTMQMWTGSTNPSIGPPEVKPMSSRPKKCRRKDKDEPKKWEKLSKKGAKMSCSICHQVGHNKKQTSTQSRRSNGTTQSSTQVGSQSNTTQAAGTSTTTTQTPRAPSSLCAETSKIRRNTPSVRDRGAVGSGGRGRDGGAFRGRCERSFAASVTSGASISATVRSVAASVGMKRTRNSDFGLYTDAQRGTRSLIECEKPSEGLISTGSNLMNAAQTNGDLGFRPNGLKWKGNRVVTGYQLQKQRDDGVSNKKIKLEPLLHLYQLTLVKVKFRKNFLVFCWSCV